MTEDKLKILHLSTYDEFGGAARAASRIMDAQLKTGIDCMMQCLVKTGIHPNVLVPQTADAKVKLQLAHSYLQYVRNYNSNAPGLFSYGDISAGLAGEINQSAFDIVNLHWVSHMLSIADIGKINKPIVWTLHDMWAFCGGEHTIFDEKHLENYMLPYNQAYMESEGAEQNKSQAAWNKKAECWKAKNFTIICPSTWLANLSKRSRLLNQCKTYVVPHPVDTENVWAPFSKTQAREQLELPAESRLLLFSAQNGVSDKIKGWDLLMEALHKFFKSTGQKDVELMVAGSEKPVTGGDFPCRIRWLGKLNDDATISKAYAAADVVVAPSRLEAFSQVCAEAQSCGVPVVAFNSGGPAEIVLHRHTGWIAKSYNTDEFSEGVAWVLENETRYSELSVASRREAVNRYSPQVVAGIYKKIYQEIAT